MAFLKTLEREIMFNRFLVPSMLSLLSIASVSCANKANSPSTQENTANYKYLPVSLADEGENDKKDFEIRGDILCHSEGTYRPFSITAANNMLKVLPDQKCTIIVNTITLNGVGMGGNLWLYLEKNGEIVKKHDIFKSKRRHVVEGLKSKNSGLVINVYTNSIKESFTTKLTKLDADVTGNEVKEVVNETVVVYSLDKFGISDVDLIYTATLDSKIKGAAGYYLLEKESGADEFEALGLKADSKSDLGSVIKIKNSTQYAHIVNEKGGLLEVILISSLETLKGYDWKTLATANADKELAAQNVK